MEAITYSLKTNQNTSDVYYKDIKTFTDEILKEFERFDTTTIKDFMLYKYGNDSKIGNHQESIFEFLMIGTFWKVYCIKATNLDEKQQKLLESLAKKRNENESPKEMIDTIRGQLMTLYLLDNTNKVEYADLTLNNFDKLLKYLCATGDFNQELLKLKFWKEYLATKSSKEVSEILQLALEFANSFESRSKIVLGKYTENVKKFLKTEHGKHLWKEDVIFCGRKEVEYHLNMLGAEIMNRTFKKEFNKRPRKALLLPGCMRSSQETCKAKETNLGLKCKKCSKSCNICELTVNGKKYGFEVYIISHESSAFTRSTKKDRDELGIIGVSCVSNLVAGGWKSESLNIPAQCVLLEHSSCKNHWHEEGYPTDINVNQLIKLFGLYSEITTSTESQSVKVQNHSN